MVASSSPHLDQLRWAANREIDDLPDLQICAHDGCLAAEIREFPKNSRAYSQVSRESDDLEMKGEERPASSHNPRWPSRRRSSTTPAGPVARSTGPASRGGKEAGNSRSFGTVATSHHEVTFGRRRAGGRPRYAAARSYARRSVIGPSPRYRCRRPRLRATRPRRRPAGA